MKIAILTAMPEEFRAVRTALQEVQPTRIGSMRACRGSASGHDILVIETGMGFRNASRAAAVVMETVAPSLLVSAGFCGAVAPDLRVGDVVLARAFYIVADGTAQPVAIRPPDAVLTLAARAQAAGQRIFAGTYAGTPTIMAKGEVARLLPAAAPSAVVEMESAAIALLAAEAGIPFIALRSVSDPRAEELDFSLDEFCDREMRIRISRVLATILRKPRIIPQLIRLARNSGIAAKNLETAMDQLLSQM